jgi:hypothetical protein
MKLRFAVLFFIIYQMSTFSCVHKDKLRKEVQMDSIFSTSQVYSMRAFDFKDISTQNVWEWPHSNNIKKLDSNFFNTFLKNEKIFNHWVDYQDYYLIGITTFGDSRYLLLGQRINNGDELNMYLVDFGTNGAIKKLIKVASQYKAPDDYIYSKSKFIDTKLTRTTIKWFADIDNLGMEYKDSIIEVIDLKDFKVVKYDSIRVK